MVTQRRTAFSLAAALGLAALATPSAARAFCGFYVSGGDQKLTNDATMVVLMREGQRTVLSMQNSYKGPPSDFAMVVPVPVVLQKENVRTLPAQVFDRVDLMASPRLVEYWEQDPCPAEKDQKEMAARGKVSALAAPMAAAKAEAQDLGVRVEAEFTVGEYEVVILSARDSDGLDTWLRQNNYKIPEGAEPVLRPYVAKGMKFFVAKVNATKVKFENGQAILSPLRFHYDSDDFSLPVRLGMLNSDGKQELVVHVLARGKRYEVANYPNVTIPTNYDVAEEARERFGQFYAALFDATLEKHPGAVVTEYSWDAGTCDPCPGPNLGPSDMLTLGADAFTSAEPPPNLATPPSVRPVIKVSPLRSAKPDPLDEALAKRIEATARTCYVAELPRVASPKGRVEITMPQGMTDEVKTTRTGSLTPTLETCVARSARWVRSRSETKRYTVDFDLEPAPPGQGWWRPPPVNAWGFTLTRLHTRYAKDGLGQDLIFREAPPIVGGREDYNVPEQDHGTKPGSTNNFQARYAIRHPWKGPIDCPNPRRGVWGGPPAGTQTNMQPKAAPKIAYVPRGQVQLASLVKQSIPDLGISVAAASNDSAAPKAGGGCACSTRDGGTPMLPTGLAALTALLAEARRRRRQAR